jgi:hypothetical protein
MTNRTGTTYGTERRRAVRRMADSDGALPSRATAIRRGLPSGSGVVIVARRPSKHTRPARPLGAGHASAAVKSDGRWLVRSIPGAAAGKAYRCPGCNQLVPAGTPHVVVWPDTPPLGAERAVDERRHWHTACWQRRP